MSTGWTLIGTIAQKPQRRRLQMSVDLDCIQQGGYLLACTLGNGAFSKAYCSQRLVSIVLSKPRVRSTGLLTG